MFGLARTDAALPEPTTLVTAGTIGFLGYGVSLAFFVFALRHLGTARTGAYSSLVSAVHRNAAVSDAAWRTTDDAHTRQWNTTAAHDEHH
jgi:hypothetical protein